MCFFLFPKVIGIIKKFKEAQIQRERKKDQRDELEEEKGHSSVLKNKKTKNKETS